MKSGRRPGNEANAGLLAYMYCVTDEQLEDNAFMNHITRCIATKGSPLPHPPQPSLWQVPDLVALPLDAPVCVCVCVCMC